MFKYPPFKVLSGNMPARLLARHWIVALCVAALAAILWIGAPAWAAPVARPLNQTVPRPTPTSEDDPLATATPQPDDDSDNSDNNNNSDSGSSDTGDNTGSVDPNSPNIVFGPGGGSASNVLTATVIVDGLNLREGPNVSYNALGNIPAGTIVSVLARNEDASWWFVCCLENSQTTGWVSAQLLAPAFDAAQADSLIPLFGAAGAATPSAPPQQAAATQATPQAPKGGQPLAVDYLLNPYFVWQGITATLTITVNNPNSVDAVNVLLSDELPVSLTLLEATADGRGAVETVTTPNKRTLLLFRWKTIPADTAVTATLVMLVNAALANGDVIDNLVATRASNVPYYTSAVTIGMPPVLPPDFQ